MDDVQWISILLLLWSWNKCNKINQTLGTTATSASGSSRANGNMMYDKINHTKWLLSLLLDDKDKVVKLKETEPRREYRSQRFTCSYANNHMTTHFAVIHFVLFHIQQSVLISCSTCTALHCSTIQPCTLHDVYAAMATSVARERDAHEKSYFFLFIGRHRRIVYVLCGCV